MTALAGRRAVLRWGWRLFRREWRQQALVLALLTIAVAAMTYLVTFAYNATDTDEARFGSAAVSITFEGTDPDATATDIATARDLYDAVDVITTREVPLPGSPQGVELRSLDPDGPFAAPMLALLSGRHPTAAAEVALTEDIARSLDAGIGDTVELDEQRWQVVGLVENPGDLDDQFVLLSPTREVPEVDEVQLLVDGDLDRADQYREQMTVAGNVMRDTPGDDRTFNAVSTLVLATIGLLQVALIAVSGFLVIAQRRQRQLGLLAAVGATSRQVRLVMLVDGACAGIAAAVVGAGIGLAAWAATSGWVEEGAGHRIDGLSVPLWVLAFGMGLAVVTATGAAWWPARLVGNVPILEALSRRPPPRRSARTSALVAVGLIAAGVTSLSVAEPDEDILLVIVGTVLTPIGVLLLAPVAIRVLTRGAARLPLAGRLALRDLGRNQARSSAALAAIGLALGIPVAVVVVANAEKVDAAHGNLAAEQLMVRTGNGSEAHVIGTLTAEQTADLDAQVDELAATLGDATVVPLAMAIDPAMPREPGLVDPDEQLAVEAITQGSGESHMLVASLYVANAELFEQLGVDEPVDAHDFYSTEPGQKLSYFDAGGPRGAEETPVDDLATVAGTGYESLPATFVSPDFVAAQGWETARAGWLLESPAALTPEQRSSVRKWAADAGLTVEARDSQTSIASLQAGATAVGMLLALSVLGMTVGLIRGEVAGDLRTLIATGASSTIRRTLTAATAAALALAGVALGVVGAYLVLLGVYSDSLGDLSAVPVVHLTVIAVGVPLVAAATSWLLAGRQPAAIPTD